MHAAPDLTRQRLGIVSPRWEKLSRPAGPKVIT